MLGSIDGSGRIRLVDPEAPPNTPTPVDLELETVLGSMPNKTFRFDRVPLQSRPLDLPEVTACLSLLLNNANCWMEPGLSNMNTVVGCVIVQQP